MLRGRLGLSFALSSSSLYDYTVVVFSGGAEHRPGHHVAHSIGKGQGQVMRLSLAQHLGGFALRVYVHQQTFLSVHRKTSPQVIDSGAFALTALFDSLHLPPGFRHIGVPTFSIDLTARGETGNYVQTRYIKKICLLTISHK